MNIFYRISDRSYPKLKLPGVDKQICLKNFLNIFDDDITIIADNVLPTTLNMVKTVAKKANVIQTNLNNAGSLHYALKESLKLKDDDVIYFVEDDYLHYQGDSPFGFLNPKTIIEEGLKRAKYVTLYDHPDKYEVEYGYGEISKVFQTSIHWRYTISTCMTFATTVKQLKIDYPIWEKYTQGSHPHDHCIFNEIDKNRETLAVCIPGLSFHTDLTYPVSKYQLNIDHIIPQWVLNIAECELKKKSMIDFEELTGIKKLMALANQS